MVGLTLSQINTTHNALFALINKHPVTVFLRAERNILVIGISISEDHVQIGLQFWTCTNLDSVFP